VLLFNRSRLMVLPQAMSKGTGLRAALNELRLSAHNAIATGDVIDLSREPYEEKVNYLKVVLPMLASLRRTTGLPHRIVVDEAHYFLHEPNVKQLLDLELGAYTVVTYRPSDLHPDLRRDIDVVVAKRLTRPHEAQALLAMAGNRNAESEWTIALGALATSEAALLPGTEEAKGKLRRFKLLPRLTPHVRHKTKYFDVQLAEGQEFVFTDNGKAIGPPARSLKQFVLLLASTPVTSLGGHARRGDFSRWIADVFQDHRLASGRSKNRTAVSAPLSRRCATIGGNTNSGALRSLPLTSPGGEQSGGWRCDAHGQSLSD
jgi:hypothetical protein